MTSLGRMLMVGIEGRKLTPAHRLFLKETGAGGVILFSRNYENPKQLSRLIADLRDAAEGPLIVGVDQEGGRVARFGPPFTGLPPMARLGEHGAADAGSLAEELGAMLGRELAAVGVDVDFAPVLDVATNPKNPVIGDRAISADPAAAAQLGAAFIRGMQSQGVAACAKHFPGHGDTDVDSHLGLPVLPHTRRRFEECEFLPFRAAVAAGVASVMIGHISAPNLDREEPASVSRSVVRLILRRELGFEGLVFTDDLEMRGIAERYPPRESAWRAVAAGADMVMVCSSADLQRDALEGLRRAAAEGLLCAEALESALGRLDSFVRRWLSGKKPPSLRVIGCSSHRKLASRLSER